MPPGPTTANAVVQSWSDTQVVALVASGSASGNPLVLLGLLKINEIKAPLYPVWSIIASGRKAKQRSFGFCRVEKDDWSPRNDEPTSLFLYPAVHRLFAFTSVARADIVEAPTFTLAPGTYAVRQFVGMSSSTPEASIRYTTDGSTPSETAGTLYTWPLTVDATTTIKAIAYEAGMTNSAVTTATYTISPPTITGVSPTTGAAGVQVTISGSGFGSAQGTGAVWLGSAAGTVVSWSDTQVVATVGSNAASGSARVRQLGTWSNAEPFNVNTATIEPVTPDSGVPGSQVTIAGSGFGAPRAADRCGWAPPMPLCKAGRYSNSRPRGQRIGLRQRAGPAERRHEQSGSLCREHASAYERRS